MVFAPGTIAALPVVDVGPDMTPSAYARCAGVISLNGVSLKRRRSSWARVFADTLAATAAIASPAFKFFIRCSPCTFCIRRLQRRRDVQSRGKSLLLGFEPFIEELLHRL